MDSAYARMKAVISELGFASANDFEDAVGLGRGFVSRIKNTVKERSMDKIRAKFPKVNPNFIRYGDGEMFSDVQDVRPKDSIRQRFNSYLEYKNMTRREFLKITGFCNAFPVAPKNGSFSAGTTYKIATNFPDLNLSWLINGTGNMLQDKNTADLLNDNSNGYKVRIVKFCKEIGIAVSRFLVKCGSSKTSVWVLPSMPTNNFLSKVRFAFPQLSIDWLLTGEGDMFNENVRTSEDSVTFIPIVPQQAHAGYLCNYADDEYISRLPTIPFVKTGIGKYMAFEVKGSSMDDGSYRSYQDGDIVICEECPSHIIRCNGINTNGKEFVIVHKQGILLKSIVSLDTEKGTITLHSFNPVFDDLTLNLEDVMQIWRVEYQQKRRK